jgi:putative transposase
MPFEFFDPDQSIDISHRRLPHWYQPGVTYFITFRTADSLPAETMKRWLEERNKWLNQHGIKVEIDRRGQLTLDRLSRSDRAEYASRFTASFHRYLDAGFGECVLRQPELHRLVAQALMHFDGVRYDLGDFVVMPNHVHLLVCFHADTKMADQCYSWKKFTAAQINKRLGRNGHFWQGESFDHLVRSPEQFAYFQEYIAQNPLKAGLQEGSFFLSTLK